MTMYKLIRWSSEIIPVEVEEAGSAAVRISHDEFDLVDTSFHQYYGTLREAQDAAIAALAEQVRNGELILRRQEAALARLRAERGTPRRA